MDAPLTIMVSVYSLMVKNMNSEHRCRLCGRVIVQRHHNARYCRECATNDIVRYGVFMADYEFVDNEGKAVRIRVARYLLRMYFIVQRGGEIVELHQI